MTTSDRKSEYLQAKEYSQARDLGIDEGRRWLAQYLKDDPDAMPEVFDAALLESFKEVVVKAAPKTLSLEDLQDWVLALESGYRSGVADGWIDYFLELGLLEVVPENEAPTGRRP